MVFSIDLFDICYCSEREKQKIFVMAIACSFVCLLVVVFLSAQMSKKSWKHKRMTSKKKHITIYIHNLNTPKHKANTIRFFLDFLLLCEFFPIFILVHTNFFLAKCLVGKKIDVWKHKKKIEKEKSVLADTYISTIAKQVYIRLEEREKMRYPEKFFFFVLRKVNWRKRSRIPQYCRHFMGAYGCKMVAFLLLVWIELKIGIETMIFTHS